MFAKVAEDVEGKFGDRIYELLFTPAAAFWVVGLLAWISADRQAHLGWLDDQLKSLTDVKLLLLSGVALALIVLSGTVYEPVNGWVLRLLAGNWGLVGAVVTWPTERLWEQCRIRNNRWRRLQLVRMARPLTEYAAKDLASLERERRYYPNMRADMLPTSVGCALVAADRRIEAKYGLSADQCWPVLALALNDQQRKGVVDARAALEGSSRLFFWALAALAWCWVSPLALLGLVAAGFGYLRLIGQARDYADAIEAAYAIGRPALYRALRLELPPNSAVERAYGEQLTQQLVRGSMSVPVAFVEGRGGDG